MNDGMTMLLLIDAGNTRIKWGVPATDGQDVRPRWLQAGSASHAEFDLLASQWQGLAPVRILVSNVAGAAMRERLSALLARLFPQLVPEWFAAAAQVAGLRNAYRDPAQLGCDRYASAIAARALYPQQMLIVATCGTATTIDAVTADGVFLGGMILPGLKLMAQSLARNTAQLPQVAESIALENPFADNTGQAIVSGCINAQAGAIGRAVHSLQREQRSPVRCIISGGAATYLIPHLEVACVHVENLVLTGLYVVAQSSPIVNRP